MGPPTSFSDLLLSSLVVIIYVVPSYKHYFIEAAAFFLSSIAVSEFGWQRRGEGHVVAVP